MAKTTETTIQVSEVRVDSIRLAIIGRTPFICNRMTEKAKRELILPKGTSTRADRAGRLKHIPLDEYRDSPYTLREDAPTRLALLAPMFKKSIATAALDTPGAFKTQINRLVHPVHVACGSHLTAGADRLLGQHLCPDALPLPVVAALRCRGAHVPPRLLMHGTEPRRRDEPRTGRVAAGGRWSLDRNLQQRQEPHGYPWGSLALWVFSYR